MTAQTKIQTMSTQLCKALGVDASAENVNKVSSLVTELVREITRENTESYHKVVKKCCKDDDNATLVRRIAEGINQQHASLIANLSAMR